MKYTAQKRPKCNKTTGIMDDNDKNSDRHIGIGDGDDKKVIDIGMNIDYKQIQWRKVYVISRREGEGGERGEKNI